MILAQVLRITFLWVFYNEKNESLNKHWIFLIVTN